MRFALLLMMVSGVAIARPWQGITPGGSSCIDVVGKFGEPTKKTSARGQEVIIYSGLQAISGTAQAQFKCDPVTKEVQRIDVYPAMALEVESIEQTYGIECDPREHHEPCYSKKETPQHRVYFLYAKVGLAIFFKDDKRTVQSFTFLPPAS